MTTQTPKEIFTPEFIAAQRRMVSDKRNHKWEALQLVSQEDATFIMRSLCLYEIALHELERLKSASAQKEPKPISQAPAAWQSLRKWQPGTFAVGVNDETGEWINFSSKIDRHLFIAGVSGSGKTQYALRPLTAMALASGKSVLCMSGDDRFEFGPFLSHPNFYFVEADFLHLDEIISRFERVVGEIEQTISWTGRDGVSEQLFPGMVIIIDDLADLVRMVSPELRKRLFRAINRIIEKGHEANFTLIASIPDPSHELLTGPLLTLWHSVTHLVFRLADDMSSLVLTGMKGAERLSQRRFFIDYGEGEPIAGIAFWPADYELMQFLWEHDQTHNSPTPPDEIV